MLVTSRDALAKSRIYSDSGVDLEPFTPDVSAAFLEELTGNASEDDHEHARRIALRLGGLPLALIQVSTILQRRDMSFEEFLEYYEEPSFLADVHRTKIGGFKGDSERSLLDVWVFEHLDPAALSLLELLSLMDADRIAESIFLDSKGSPNLENFPLSPLVFEAARTKLLQASLVKRNKETKEMTVYRIIQDSVRARLSAETFAACFKVLLDLLLISWPKGSMSFSHETSRWGLCGKILPHIERLMSEYRWRPVANFESESLHKFATLLIDAGW